MNQANEKQQLKSLIDQADTNLLKILSDAVEEYRSPSRTWIKKNSQQIYRLIYTSVRAKTCDDHEIDKILQASRRNNEKLGVTGILIATSHRFLQVLEGPKDELFQLYEKIKKDERHAGPIMRYCHPSEKRYFGNWLMGSKQFDSPDITYKTEVSGEDKKTYAAMLDGDVQSYQEEGMKLIRRFLARD